MVENPPAFPRPGFADPAGMQDGMTMRDWFAGQVLAGTGHRVVPEFAARNAYQIADAMLAVRADLGATRVNVAARDLYAALQNACDTLKAYQIDHADSQYLGAIDDCEAALAKARGEA